MAVRTTGRRREYSQDQLDRLQELRQQAADEPMDWFPHDADMHRDPKVRKMLASPQGTSDYGRWNLLCEMLCSSEGHCYDLSDDLGWTFLASDLMCTVEECRAFVSRLLELGLVSRDSFDGFHRLRSDRMQANADTYADGKAKHVLGAEITNGMV